MKTYLTLSVKIFTFNQILDFGKDICGKATGPIDYITRILWCFSPELKASVRAHTLRMIKYTNDGWSKYVFIVALQINTFIKLFIKNTISHVMSF